MAKKKGRKKERRPEIYYKEDHVAIVGDSILQKVDSIRNAIVRSYRGDTLEDIRNHMVASHYTEYIGKKIVIVHAGTNDIEYLTVDQMIADLKSIVDAIREENPGAIIVYSDIISRPKDFTTTEFKRICFNDEVKFWARMWGIKHWRTSRHFMYKNKPDKDMFYEDNLHPSTDGAKYISQYFTKNLSFLLNDLHLCRNSRDASETYITKKPRQGYKYWYERLNRVKILHRDKVNPKGPTYAPYEPKEIHKPREGPRKRKKKKKKKKLEVATNNDTRIVVLNPDTKSRREKLREKMKIKRKARRQRKRQTEAKARKLTNGSQTGIKRRKLD